MNSFSTQTLFELPIFSGTKTELYALLQAQLQQDTLLTIATPNPEQVIQSTQDSQFLKDLQAFDVLLPDGQGIVWASHQLNQPIPERIPGVEVVEWLLGLPEDQRGKILIVGGKEYRKETRYKKQDTNDAQKLVIKDREVFWIEGYQNIKNPSETEEEHIQAVIKQMKPSIILVAFGAPWQEQWVVNHREFLEKNKVKLVMVVGGAIDMLTGKVQRAPKFVQQLQLEWLFRLIQQPWRWKRQLRLIQFIGHVLKEK